MAFSIQFRDDATPALKAAPRDLRAESVALVAGRALTNLLRLHFFRLDRERPNRLGGKRTHFHAQVGRSVQQPRGIPGGSVVSINHVGARQRLEGGTIRALNSKRLTIPARAEYHGKRAGEFNNLHYVRFKSGAEALVEADATQLFFRKLKSGVKRTTQSVGGLVAYWLKKFVVQKPDPTFLPPQAEMERVARTAAEGYVNRILNRSAGVQPATNP